MTSSTVSNVKVWELKDLPHSFTIEVEGASEQYTLRPLELTDFQKGFRELLGQLSNVGDLNEERFQKAFEIMGSSVRVIVVEHRESGKLVSAASMVEEQKFLRNAGKVCHIEDVVTDANFRRRGFTKMILTQLLAEAQQKGNRYKVILDCTEQNVPVYAKIGLFTTGEVQMRCNL